jgi:hypothetical protein
MKFEWDIKKNKENRKKHGVSFSEAEEVFEDPFHISVLDRRFDYLEERWITMGLSGRDRLLVVGHMYRMDESGTEITRLITARRATNREHERYEKI